MRTVELAGSGIRTTTLGFGSAALLGRLGEKESLRLLERAYEEGIRYFDTAPSYGYGNAEDLLGKFAAGKTDVVVATKFGLTFQGRSSSTIKLAMNLARPVLRRVPGLRARAGALARRSTPAVSNFNPAFAKECLASSLRKLRRDVVDVLLLHECRAADLTASDLLSFLTEAIRRGDIRSFGIGTDAGTIAHALRWAPEYTQVIQFENNARNRVLERLEIDQRTRTVITHTPFGGVGNTIDGDPRESFLYALRSNHNGVVLFSTTKEARIAENVRLASEPASR